MTRETIGRYQIQSELGRGGMATVYLAYDPNFHRNVAIKVVSVNYQENAVFKERFEREARLIAKIEHPAIVPVYDFGEHDNQRYLVMRYMPGGTLANKIKDGSLTFKFVTQIISQIAPALDAVHAQDVVHRDLKPGNILFDGFGNAAISDFGIAHLSAATSDLTGSAIIGTPSYMSPEQVRGDADLDGRSDIYALGVILFEMLTGEGPFRAATPLSVALKHLTDPIPSIRSNRPDLPMEVESILNKALAKDREMRYTNASELAREMQMLLGTFQDSEMPARGPVRTAHGEEVSTEMDLTDESQPSIDSILTSHPEVSQVVSTESVDQSISSGIPARQPPRRILQIAAIGVVGLLLFVFCSSVGLFGILARLGFQAQTPTAPPTISVTNTSPVQDTILFSDDFSNPLSGWPTIRNAQGGYSYQEDGYHILVDEINVLWAKTNGQYDNISTSVDAKPVAEGSNGFYGLLCRIQEDQNFYYFAIQSNGNYDIGKYKYEDNQFISFFGGLRSTNAINQGNQLNRLRADCVADRLRFYVNNVLLDEATDTEFTSGFSGIVVAAIDNQGLEVVFNDFRITSP